MISTNDLSMLSLATIDPAHSNPPQPAPARSAAHLTAYLKISLISVLACAWTDITFAADTEQIREAVEETRLVSSWNWLEQQRDDVSRNVSNVGRYLDDWLAGEGVGERTNESYLRLKLNQRISRYDSYEGTVRISGRIDLPRATERWKLIFESEDAERTSLSDQRLNNIRPSSISGGFSYRLPDRDGLQMSHDVGVRGRLPVDPFYRFKVRYGKDLSEDWYGGVDSKTYFYHHDGWGHDTRIYFSRNISDRLNFRTDSEVKYSHKDNEFEFGQSFSLHQSLGERETLTYEFGVIGVSQPDPRTENLYLQAVYRKAIYKDWLILELAPQLIAERENDWKPDPQFQFNLEVYFFDF
jgi:hypothetical protein